MSNTMEETHLDSFEPEMALAVIKIGVMEIEERDQFLRDLLVTAREAYRFIRGPEVWKLAGAGQVGYDLGLALEDTGVLP